MRENMCVREGQKESKRENPKQASDAGLNPTMLR